MGPAPDYGTGSTLLLVLENGRGVVVPVARFAEVDVPFHMTHHGNRRPAIFYSDEELPRLCVATPTGHALDYLTPAIFIAKLTMLNEKVEGKGDQAPPPSFRSNVETNWNPRTLITAGSVCGG